MSLKNLPPCPPSLKPIQHYLKTAAEHEERDIVVTYWCRLYALQMGLRLDKSSPDALKILGSLMDWLERIKSDQKDNETIAHDIPAQAHLENYALKLFLWADSQDRASIFNKNVIKAFYTSGMIFDVLETFGELTEEVQQNRKYAKWKAAYIHNCLKNGEVPLPGPMEGEDEDEIAPGPANIGFNPRQLPDIPESSNNPSLTNTLQPEPSVTPSAADFASIFTPAEVVAPKSGTGAALSAEQITKAQKYCKFASSALNYDDVATAVANLQKALSLLTTGVDQ